MRLPFSILATLALAVSPLLAKGSSMDPARMVESAIQGNHVEFPDIAAPDTIAFIRALASRFATETSEARREKIVQLVDEFRNDGASIRDTRIIAGLLRGASSLDDDASTAALGLLSDHGDPEAMAAPAGSIFRDLEHEPSDKWLELATVAKPKGILPDLRRLERKFPRLATGRWWRVAMAANGDEAIETAYVEEFLKTEDPRRKEDLMVVLDDIGTRKAYGALAQEMRSTMVTGVKDVFQYPMRELIGKRLVSAFPEIVLQTGVNSESGYATIEAFCEKKFGTKWKTPRPPVVRSGPLKHGFSIAPKSFQKKVSRPDSTPPAAQ